MFQPDLILFLLDNFRLGRPGSVLSSSCSGRISSCFCWIISDWAVSVPCSRIAVPARSHLVSVRLFSDWAVSVPCSQAHVPAGSHLVSVGLFQIGPSRFRTPELMFRPDLILFLLDYFRLGRPCSVLQSCCSGPISSCFCWIILDWAFVVPCS